MIIKQSAKISFYKKLPKINLKSRGFFISVAIASLVFIIVIISFGFGLNYGIKSRYTNRIGAMKGLLNNMKKTGLKVIPNYIKGTFQKTDHFYIDIKHMDFQKIMYNRQISLDRGVILEDVKQEKFPATLTYKNKSYRVNLEMIGQNLDHISRPNKWSLKVRVRGDNAVLGMKEFSLLVPDARGSYHYSPVHEWVCHQLEKEEGLITLRYDFVHVTINGKFHGVYALEEHFGKYLIENNNKREGIIFKPGLRDISVYNQNKILADPVMKSQLSLLKVLWKSFIVDDISASKLFDIEQLAKRYAIADLVNGHHVHWLGNTFFYFNPITRLLEPIGREWESPYHKEFSLYIENPIYDPEFHRKLFSDPIFVQSYIAALDRISKPEYLDNFFNKVGKSLNKKLDILDRDYPAYQYSSDYLYENQKLIHNRLYPYKSVIVSYVENVDEKSLNLLCANLQSIPVEIVGIEYDNNVILKSSNNQILRGTIQNESPEYENLQFSVSQNFIKSDSVLNNLKVQYKLLGMNEIEESLVFPWSIGEIDKYGHFPIVYDNGYTTNEFISVDEDRKSIFIKKGKWKLKKNLIIPKDYKLICEEDTHLDMLSSSKILSYSPLIFIGSEEYPISIDSSDSTGQGFVILNTKKKSVLKHVVFENLNNSRQNGWELTGCITFYESPVEFYNCQFLGNRSGDDYLNIIRSEFVLSSVLFKNTFADALDIDFCAGDVLDSTFINCGNDAVDASGSNFEFNNIYINGAGDKGISAGEHSKVIADKIVIDNAEIAVASKDISEIMINEVNISDSKVGFTAFQKKPEFGPASIHATNIDLKHVQVPFLLEESSLLVAEGNEIKATRKNVQEILYGVEFGKPSK